MYWDIETSPDEEEELIKKTAKKIHARGIDTAVILFLESTKPLAYIGGEMSRLFISPFLPALGEPYGITGEKLINVFEKRENIEKLILLLEEMTKEDEKRKKKERENRKDTQERSQNSKKGSEKRKGLRKYIPW
jgi:hypothetical protein